MSFQEKSAWIVLVGVIAAIGFYGLHLYDVGIAGLTVGSVLTATVGFVVLVTIGHIAIAATAPKESDRTDERDRAVDRRTDRVSELTLSAVIVCILGYGLLNGDMVLSSFAFLGLFGATLIKHVMMVILYRTGA